MSTDPREFEHPIDGTVGTVTPQAIEAAARALAHTFGADDCFERVDEWEALEDWEREAHPNERPGFDYEDCSNYRRSATAALSAAYPLMEAEALLGLERVLFDIESQHHIHDVECLCGFKSHRSRSRTEHITGLVRAATIEGKSE